ncbi:MAG TPA: hypothetical protein PKK06_03335 [Phycisphaerae bacterium]|nr:hypothetical protein [Phycisphaerae bacterium]HNU44719.1 hypothetical protein [Phycisphaerae bacterium]
MQRNLLAIVVLAAVVLYALTALGQLRTREEPGEGQQPASAAVFRVTLLPDHADSGTPYSQELEAYLNRMAGDGWRFHSTLVAQNRAVLVFERVRGQ